MNDAGPIYLSPHHDDACFSLATVVRRLGGVLVNVFTISAYTDEELRLSTDPAFVSDLRDREDLSFAQACGLARINLGQLDSPLRNRDPFDAADIEGDVEDLRPHLRRILQELAMPGHRRLLFCPAAIGHRDHIAVREVVLSDYDALRRSYRIAFYEDLPYAADRGNRDRGLATLEASTAKLGYSKMYRVPASPEKLALARLYASQFDRLPEDLSQFTPADSEVPLETLWVNETIAAFESWESSRASSDISR